MHAPSTNTMGVCMDERRDAIPVSQGSGGLDKEKMDEGGFLDVHGTRRFSISVSEWDINAVP